MNSPFIPNLKLAKTMERLRKPLPSLDQAHLIPTSTFTHARTIKTPPVEFPKFDGSDFEAFFKTFSRWLRLTQVEYSDERTKLEWLVAASIGKSAIIVENLADDATTLIETLDRMATVFPKLKMICR